MKVKIFNHGSMLVLEKNINRFLHVIESGYDVVDIKQGHAQGEVFILYKEKKKEKEKMPIPSKPSAPPTTLKGNSIAKQLNDSIKNQFDTNR